MKNKLLFILCIWNIICVSSCITTQHIPEKEINSYTSEEIKQYIQKRFLYASDSLKIGDDFFVIDGIPRDEEEIHTIDKKDIRSIYFVDIRKNALGCNPAKYDLFPIIRTNKAVQKRKAKKETLTWIKDLYFGEHSTVNERPLVIFNRKPLTIKTAFQLLQTLKVGHIDYIQKNEEPQVIAGFEQNSKYGVVEIFTK
ncbi:hypothetical protein [uncultured Kordia sp.]|uniref:hypothetical protein n=1 Tax=uncultured Kordia sp. TaxID=507699 RepID=UPI00260C2C98|nr:hypothetical protein [uncultured Kordia sp.]